MAPRHGDIQPVGMTQQCMGFCVLWIRLQGLLDEWPRFGIRFPCQPTVAFQSPQVRFIGCQTIRWSAPDTGHLCFAVLHIQRGNDLLGYLILKREDIFEFTLIGPSPFESFSGCIDKLSRDLRPVSGFANTTLNDVSGAQFLANLMNLDLLAPV